jgi:hypothetical protein
MVLGIVLGAAPAVAAVPCLTSSGASSNHAGCCAGMAKSTFSEVGSGSANNQDLLSQPSCCKPSSEGYGTQAIARGTERPTFGVAPFHEFSAIGLFIPVSPSREVHTSPDPPDTGRLRSILCMFRI